MTDEQRPAAGHHPDDRRDDLPHDLCDCLRTKAMTMGAYSKPTIAEDAGAADTAIYHCMVTMATHGPDEDDVMPCACRPGRQCYVPASPLV